MATDDQGEGTGQRGGDDTGGSGPASGARASGPPARPFVRCVHCRTLLDTTNPASETRCACRRVWVEPHAGGKVHVGAEEGGEFELVNPDGTPRPGIRMTHRRERALRREVPPPGSYELELRLRDYLARRFPEILAYTPGGLVRAAAEELGYEPHHTDETEALAKKLLDRETARVPEAERRRFEAMRRLAFGDLVGKP